MNAVWIDATQMYRKYLTSLSKTMFYNYVVGEPYQDESLALADIDVLSHRRTYLPQRLVNRGDYALITVGIDWGVEHSIVIMGRRHTGEEDIINLFTVKETAGFTGDVDRDIREIIERIRLYEPDLIVADIGYNGSRINTLVKTFGKKVYGVQVNPAKSNGQVDAQWNDANQKVTIDKLTQNRIMLEKIKRGDLGFWQKQDAELLMYIEHWKNVIIRDVEEDDGTIGKEITRKGSDHTSQSSIYANIAMVRLTKAMVTTKNSFGYTEVNSSEQANMNQAFDDLLRRPER